jgi:hypothetical protein
MTQPTLIGVTEIRDANQPITVTLTDRQTQSLERALTSTTFEDYDLVRDIVDILNAIADARR